MRTYSEQERFCTATFKNGGPYWHAYTSGKETPILFVNEDDFSFVMNVIAQAKAEVPAVIILAFEVMNNHFHFVLAAERESVECFWAYIHKRLKRRISRITKTRLFLKPIEDLSSLRNNIVYTHRNGYVANPDYTPFSYPWGSGRYYFLDHPQGLAFQQLPLRDKRKSFHCRKIQLPADWQMLTVPVSEPSGYYVSPSSYCAADVGMSLFRNAHHYFSLVSKNVEAYSGIAREIDDGEFLTDSEVFSLLLGIVRDNYHLVSLKDLSNAQKLDLARSLRYEYRSSNGQIRRLLGLSQFEVDSLFPGIRQDPAGQKIPPQKVPSGQGGL